MKRNLVDVLDGALKLYGPTIFRLADAHPGAESVRTGLDPRDPVAYVDRIGPEGLDERAFDRAATEAVRALAPATAALVDSCPLTADGRGSLQINGERTEAGFEVVAMVTNGLGGLVAKRRLTAFARGASLVPVMHMGPAALYLTSTIGAQQFPDERSLPEAGFLDGLRSAASRGMEAAARFLIGADAVMRLEGQDATAVLDWLAQFPSVGGAVLSKLPGSGHTVSVESSQGARDKILVRFEGDLVGLRATMARVGGAQLSHESCELPDLEADQPSGPRVSP